MKIALSPRKLTSSKETTMSEKAVMNDWAAAVIATRPFPKSLRSSEFIGTFRVQYIHLVIYNENNHDRGSYETEARRSGGGWLLLIVGRIRRPSEVGPSPTKQVKGEVALFLAVKSKPPGPGSVSYAKTGDFTYLRSPQPV